MPIGWSMSAVLVSEPAHLPVTDTGYHQGRLQHPKKVHLTDQVNWEDSEYEGETRIGRVEVLVWRDKMEKDYIIFYIRAISYKLCTFDITNFYLIYVYKEKWKKWTESFSF